MFQIKNMKTIASSRLLEALKADTRQIILTTNYLLQQDPEILTLQPSEGKWSVSQSIEHLNSYGRYYLPLISASMTRQSHTPEEVYTPGWLGDYFTKSMLPKSDGKITNKMQSPKNHRPSQDLESRKVLEDFLQQEYLLMELLDQAATTNLGKIRIPISINRFIRIKLGDTFRFLIAHHQRHFLQIQNTLKVISQSKQTEVSLIKLK